MNTEECNKGTRQRSLYTIVKELGKGAFGETFLVTKTDDSRTFVLKRLRIKSSTPSTPMTPSTPSTPISPGSPGKQTQAIDLKEIFLEIDILRKIEKHGCRPDILCFHEYFVDCEAQTINIVTLAFENAITLSEYIISYQRLNSYIPKKSLLQIMYNILEPLYYLTKLGIAHGDIKPDNILINPDTLTVQIIDFGLACSKKCKPAGTLLFASPEVLHDLFITRQIPLDELQQGDVFSLGIVFYLMANLRLPYPTKGHHKFEGSFTDSMDSNLSEVEEDSVSVRENDLSYNPIELNDRMVMRVQLEKFYKTHQNSIISMYNNNRTDLDDQINKLIESMMRLDTKKGGGRPSMKRVLSIIKKIIVEFNNSLILLQVDSSKLVQISDVTSPTSPTTPITPN